jgi:hypothetical protein
MTQPFRLLDEAQRTNIRTVHGWPAPAVAAGACSLNRVAAQ